MPRALYALALAIVVAGGLIYFGLIDIPPAIPVGDGQFSVVWVPGSSDTDRTEVSETVSGNQLIYVLSDANMDGLGDVTLDMRVTHVGGDASDFQACLGFTDFTFASGNPVQQPIANYTDQNSRRDITWSLVDSGAPTAFQSGECVTAADWPENGADTLRATINLSPAALDDVGAGAQVRIELVVGNQLMVVIFQESA